VLLAANKLFIQTGVIGMCAHVGVYMLVKKKRLVKDFCSLNVFQGYWFELKTVCFCLLINQQRNFLVTIGEDEQLTPQQSALCLKVFDLDKMQSESTSTASPDCVGILRIFTNQFPEAMVMTLLCSLLLFYL